MCERSDFDGSGYRRALLGWYDANRRDLPWRRTADPYAIWVSEVMLQQTQVSRVVDYWQRFLVRFPTVRAVAEAPLDDVLARWSGLGYYRRARMLHAAARAIAEEHGGELPHTAAELRALPGMGEYTAAAVASIAFGETVACVDANVVRVLARLFALDGDPSRGTIRRRLRDEAELLLDPARPGDYNQAVMELGALVCTPTSPGCAGCPVAGLCRAGAEGSPTRYPQSVSAGRTVSLREVAAVVVCDEKVLLVRGGHERGWWEGLWSLPRVALADGADPVEAVTALVAERLDRACVWVGEATASTYGVTKHTVTMHAVPCAVERVTVRCPPNERATVHSSANERVTVHPSVNERWFAFGDIDEVGIPSPDRRALERALGRVDAWPR